LSLNFSISQEKQLDEIVKKLIKSISAPQIFFFDGEVGSGKTTLIRYLLEGISKLENKKLFFQGSPTYQREHIYNFKKYDVVHFDFYQVDNSSIDIDEYLLNNCIFIEWPLEAIKSKYFDEALFIKIDLKNKIREIKIQSRNNKWLQKIK
jgi:tRNA threonylcarbamoyladenosine biosynthesis protein TsaE